MSSRELYAFFAGGRDLEMITICQTLHSFECLVFDKNLGWGAKASSYADEIGNALRSGLKPVIIELTNDLPEGLASVVIDIDHHGKRAGSTAQTSLEQILDLLEVPESDKAANRWWQLVSANDRGHIRAMRQLAPPASDSEIRQIRLADLDAQGVTQEMIDQAKADIEHRTPTTSARLLVVPASSDRTNLVAEFCEPFFDGPGFENLIVKGTSEVAFYGSGDVVSKLVAACPEGDCWFGGSLPEFGFWGAKSSGLAFAPVEFVSELLS